MPTISRTLSEDDSARLVARYGVPFADRRRVADADAAAAAGAELGFPVVVKLHGERIAHKTERGLVRLNLADATAVRAAAADLLAATRDSDGPVDLLVSAMIDGTRELVVGMHADPQFGRCVMVGIGGVLTEVLGDVTFRLVPLTRHDANDMIDELAHQSLLAPVRGEPAVDRDALARVLLALSDLAIAEAEVVSVDLNPLLVVDGTPVAVDALVELTG